MKTVWELRDKNREQVGVITIEGDWRDVKFRNTYFEFLKKMSAIVSDSSEQTITEDKECC